MTLTGREIQAFLGATLLHFEVPFVETRKVALSAADRDTADAARARLLAAKSELKPAAPRDPSAWQLMLDDAAELLLTGDEARVLAKVAVACLAELRTDGDLSALAGPGVDLAALRSAIVKLKDLARSPS